MKKSDWWWSVVQWPNDFLTKNDPKNDQFCFFYMWTWLFFDEKSVQKNLDILVFFVSKIWPMMISCTVTPKQLCCKHNIQKKCDTIKWEISWDSLQHQKIALLVDLNDFLIMITVNSMYILLQWKLEIIAIKKCLCLFNRAKIVLKLELGLGLGLVS